MSQYFENNSNLKDEKKCISINFQNKTYPMYTNNGLFCKEHFDYGSRLLLTQVISEPLSGKILDLGCGYGAIGIIIARTHPQTKVDMVDITDLALKTATDNAKLNNVKNVNIFKSNVYEKITDKYNYIITNPPIRAGKEIIRKFLIGAKDHLEKDGQLWFVMRKDHGVKTMIKELEEYYSIKISEKSKGFYIVCANVK